MTDANTQAIADALQRLKKATDRHKAAMKQLDDWDHIFARVGVSRVNPNPLPVSSWEIAVDYPDMRYEGGLKIGGRGEPILSWQWPSGERIIEVIKEKQSSAAERDEVREMLAELGFDIQQLAS